MHEAEKVLVVNKADVELPDDARTFPADDVLAGLHSGDIPVMFAARSEVETDETRLQIIPYVVVTSGSGVFGYCRAVGGDQRLEGKWSVGIGGHVNDTDAVLRNGSLDVLRTIVMSTYREADEETSGLVSARDKPLAADGEWDTGLCSVYDWAVSRNVEQVHSPVCIYTPDNAVGRVHLGLLIPLTVDNRTLYDLTTKDPTLKASRVFTRPMSKPEFDRMELWSQLALSLAGFC